MDGKKRRMPRWTLALCAILLALNLWQGWRLQSLRQRQTAAVNRLDRPEESSEQPGKEGEGTDFA